MAAEYARNRDLHPGVLRALIAGGEITPTSRVLEVGCGTGNYVNALQGAGCARWGIDPSEQMLGWARRRSREVAFQQGAAEQLDFPDASFDFVFSVDVIHHVRDRAAYFGEAARILAPGGRLCTVTESVDDIRHRLHSRYFPESVDVEVARYASIAMLRSEMRSAGFGAITDQHVDLASQVTDATPYRERAFSSLHLISDEAFARGIARLEDDVHRGPVSFDRRYTLVWGVARGK